MNDKKPKIKHKAPFRGKKFTHLEGRRFVLERDVNDVLHLYEQVFGKAANQELWEWKYLPPWTKQAYAWIGVADGQVIGHMGAVPLRGQVDGKEVLFFQFGDIMVNPDYRSRIIYMQLSPAKLIEEIRSEHPQAVIYGFTSHKLARFYAWFTSPYSNTSVELAEDRIVRLSQEPCNEPDLSQFKVCQWSWNAPELDDVWQQQKDTVRVGLVRDRTYLEWRYANHPALKYCLFGIYYRKKTVGWLVTGDRHVSEQWEDEVRIHDFLLPSNIRLPALRKATSRLQAKSLVLWLPSNCLIPGLESRDTNWRVMHFSLSPAVSKDFLASNVYYSLGEADEWWW